MNHFSKSLFAVSIVSCLISTQVGVSAGEAKTAGLSKMVAKQPKNSPIELKAPAGGVLAVVFYSIECPISNEYSPTLNALAKATSSPKVKMIGVCVDPDATDEAIVTHAKEYSLAFPVAEDRSGRLARKLAISITPEVVVIDDSDHIRYRGRIDDQYAKRGVRNENPEHHEFRDAITSILAGKPVAVTEAPVVGCPLPRAEEPKTGPTYSGEVGAILASKCVDCHRPGQVGPFSLTTYEQARKRADDIASVVESRSMPPWKPAPGFGPKIKHDRSLSQAEIETLVSWAEAGAPRGESTEAKTPTVHPEGWALGTPDLVIKMPVSYPIPASGGDIYRCFVIPTNLLEDRYVSAVEYRPGNRSVVHHILCYVDTSGKAREKDAAEPGPGYTCFGGPQIEPHGDLGGWAPGNEPSFLPDGIGRSMPKGSDVVMQVHYHPNGKPEVDQTEIGIHFSRKPVSQVLHWAAAANMRMELPPNQPRIEIRARWKAPVDLDAYAVAPHMHLLGRDMTMVITEPDGKTQPLVKIDDWDFQWQNSYYFDKPIRIKAGSTLDVVAHFDNSKDNPRNPNRVEPKTVRWGEATTDEMCIGFLAVTKASQDLRRSGEVDDLAKIIQKTYDDEWAEIRKAEAARKAKESGK